MNRRINRVGGEIPLLCFVSRALFIAGLWEGEAIKLQNPTPLLKMNKNRTRAKEFKLTLVHRRPYFNVADQLDQLDRRESEREREI